MKVRQLEACRGCSGGSLSLVLSLGWLPLANRYLPTGSAESLPFFPHEFYRCDACGLVQLGILAESSDVFDVGYPYRSGLTKQLRDNFAGLVREVTAGLRPTDLVVDIGGNDGTLLSGFVGTARTLNVTPEDMGRMGIERGIPHLQAYWGKAAAADVLAQFGKARVVTATNVFAHIESPGAFLDAAIDVLADDGILVLEVQYLGDLIDGNQWDHGYLEHQIFWSLNPLQALLNSHGLFVRSVKRIPTHGGSVRVICDRKKRDVKLLEKPIGMPALERFARRVAESKADLWSLLSANHGAKIAGIGAPSRASTLVSYVGLDHNIISYVSELPGSKKPGHFMPGTRIPILVETHTMVGEDQPDLAIVFSHHLADEIMPKIRARGFKGKFIRPLPTVEVIG